MRAQQPLWITLTFICTIQRFHGFIFSADSGIWWPIGMNAAIIIFSACGFTNTNTMIKLLEKNMDSVVSCSSSITSKVMCTFVFQRFVGRQTGESAWRVARQEVLQCHVSFGFQFHVRSNPNGGQSHGFKHSAAAREEDGDPREQRHYQSGKACREIRNHQLH